jgi:hypothetical protein
VQCPGATELIVVDQSHATSLRSRDTLLVLRAPVVLGAPRICRLGVSWTPLSPPTCTPGSVPTLPLLLQSKVENILPLKDRRLCSFVHRTTSLL